jgi:hypothetical protein
VCDVRSFSGIMSWRFAPIPHYKARRSNKPSTHNEMAYERGDIFTVKAMATREGWVWAQKQGIVGATPALVGFDVISRLAA